MTHVEFIQKLREICRADTSANPTGWSRENPLWGHCAVVSLLAQDYFGGEILRSSLEGYPKYAHLRSHYWNRLKDGDEVDFTAEQYPDLSIAELNSVVRARENILGYPDTVVRYQLFKERFSQVIC